MTLTLTHRRSAAILILSVLFAGAALAPSAHASRTLLSEAALKSDFCNHCPPTAAQPPFTPPSEGQIEGACGLAIKPDGGIYVSDYYHRVIDDYGPFGGQPAPYQSQIALPGANSTFGTNTLDAVCGLAFDAAENLYVNEFHRRVLQLTPSEVTIDSGESTGLAIDSSTNRLYVDDRTYLAEYALPFTAGDQSLAKIATDPSADYFGLAAFEGRLYVADASDQTVRVFEPASSVTTPVHTTSAGFASLTDASFAIDPTNGHLLVVDDIQPLFEHPKTAVHEFAAPPGYANLGTLPGSPIFGGPSGIAVAPDGTVLVTDGNSELANAFAYGPYQAGFAPLAPEPPASASTSAALERSAASGALEPAPTPAGTLHSPRRRPHNRHRRGHHTGAGERR